MAEIGFEEVVKTWRAKNIQTVADIDVALSDIRVLFAYNSNKIEDAGVSFHQTREIFENGKVVGYTGDLRALFEAQNQKECYEFIKSKIADKELLSSDLIREIHEILCHGCYDESRWAKGERPGEYKKNFYGVGLSVGLPPEDVEEEMDYICNEIASTGLWNGDASPEKVLKAAIWFHCSFERIHPFADGNGRVGRTLLNYILMVAGLPPVVIFDEDKETYFMALEVFDHSDEIDGFVAFIKEQMVKTWVRKGSKGAFVAL
ncbi:Fic family protein [Butyrivibrio sp. NC2007]|uniref:Fic family protein n=1 Tax=Butyrivibrio sp. NC2007 TaxID=1280683 RepID=UPI0003B63712|nr:Fic family protein [Butyrivibrio sp. NC2007]